MIDSSINKIDQQKGSTVALLFVGVFTALLMGCGCTSLYYIPSKRIYPYYKAERYPPEDIYFASGDGTRLHAWYFAADKDKCPKAKGLMLHFHGNAQNLSTHYQFLHWITEECFDSARLS